MPDRLIDRPRHVIVYDPMAVDPAVPCCRELALRQICVRMSAANKANDDHACAAPRPHAVDAIFDDHTALWSDAKLLSRKQKQVWGRFPVLNLLG